MQTRLAPAAHLPVVNVGVTRPHRKRFFGAFGLWQGVDHPDYVALSSRTGHAPGRSPRGAWDIAGQLDACTSRILRISPGYRCRLIPSVGSGFTVAKDPSADPGTLEDINCATAHLEARLPHTLRPVEPLYAALYHLHRPVARVGWLTFARAAPEARSIRVCRASISSKANGGRRSA